MNKKKIYNKPIAKVVKIDHVHLLNESRDPYVPGGTGGGKNVQEVLGSTEAVQE